MHSPSIQLRLLSSGITLELSPALLSIAEPCMQLCRQALRTGESIRVKSPFGAWRVRHKTVDSAEELDIRGGDGPLMECVGFAQGPGLPHWKRIEQRCRELHQQRRVTLSGPPLSPPIEGPWVAAIHFPSYFRLSERVAAPLSLILLGFARLLLERSDIQSRPIERN